MRKFIATICSVTLLFASATVAVAQEQGRRSATPAPDTTTEPAPQHGHFYTPESSIERPEDAGLRAHTNYVIHSLDGTKPRGVSSPRPLGITAGVTTTEEPETPQSLGCLYVKSPSSAGCVPNYDSGSGGPSAAGWGAIALVDAYDNPDASTDLENFDSYWGLAAPPAFIKIEATGNGSCSSVPANAGWSVEASIDIELAHVFAPKATIILVEACSNSNTDLFYAEGVAINYIQANYGGGDVSNSWGGAEFSGETAYDSIFEAAVYTSDNPVMVFASAGDSGCGAAYPSSNPWLVSAGGTSVVRKSTNLDFSSEACWSSSGGGTSAYETTTAATDFQYPIFGTSGRRTPDMSFDADPNSGVWIYNAYDCGGFCVYGGTSVASPALAGIVNRSGNKLSTWYGFPIDSFGYFSSLENNLLYSQLPTAAAYKANFYDVKTGSNTTTACTSKAVANWDYCTGVGSPRGLLGK